MGKIQDFYQLDTWKEGHKLALLIYKKTKEFPKEEKYGLISQLQRASSSITANIAEGFGRYHYPEKIRFYRLSRGSLKEVQNFVLLARDLEYLPASTAKEIWQLSKNCEKLINGLIRSTEGQKRVGD
ncbi:MAG: four helix bundle protein [Patescibacteria group bacterium]